YFNISVLALGASLLAGCGGGSSSQAVQQPVAPADFSLTFSTNSVTVAQGATSPSLTVSVSPQNGFTGALQLTLTSIPLGIASNPPSPFPVPTGGAATVLFSATSTAPTGIFSISAQGTSGNLTHSATLTLTVQAAAVTNLPRSTFVRTDSVAAL